MDFNVSCSIGCYDDDVILLSVLIVLCYFGNRIVRLVGKSIVSYINEVCRIVIIFGIFKVI